MQLGCGLGFRLRLLDGERHIGVTADILWTHFVHCRRWEVFRSIPAYLEKRPQEG